MKPKIVLTVASLLYFLLTVASLSMLGGGFNFLAYLAIVLTLCLAVLFWSARNAPSSSTLDAILLTGFLAYFLGSIIAFYVEGVAWLAMAVWFFLVRRVNKAQ